MFSFHVGILQTYLSLHLILLALFFIVLLFWAVMFPFRYRTFKNAGRFKYVYTAMVITGILLPCVPPIINLAFEYGITNIPTTWCVAATQGVALYTQSLPETISGAVMGTLLVLVFLNILKVLIELNIYPAHTCAKQG